MPQWREIPYQSLLDYLNTFAGTTRLAFGGACRWGILALEAKPCSLQEVAKLPLKARPGAWHLPFYGGYFGVIPYGEDAKPRLYRVEEALIFDQENRRLWHVSEKESFCALPQVVPVVAENRPSITLKGREDGYLAKVARVRQEILKGRFYQLNLLRYFELAETPSFLDLLQIWRERAGSFACWFAEAGEWELFSLSPERFFSVEAENGQMVIAAEPIKGTLAVSQGSSADLLASEKDQAELAMIIDLMRSDLSKVAQEVRLDQPPHIRDAFGLYHLVARVKATLLEGTTIGDLWSATFPGGSITGAPKLEVMEFIRELEGRSRRYFMGTSFYFDPHQGRFDSSILIRTMVREATGPCEYAAGSGLVLASDPKKEAAEIVVKCKALGEVAWSEGAN